jgi:hypothetical protein
LTRGNEGLLVCLGTKCVALITLVVGGGHLDMGYDGLGGTRHHQYV